VDGHGYLSIAPSDTSVMLIDCERMAPIWNRAAASTGNKYSLLSKPRKTPGLWGQLDRHWNARDQEYIEGRTMCLHYTALHQQPWEPFPEHYSYHPNPLAYLWHDLEQAADAEGYQVFSRGAPSPGFLARLGTNEVRPAARPARLPSVARPGARPCARSGSRAGGGCSARAGALHHTRHLCDPLVRPYHRASAGRRAAGHGLCDA
jgi:hypothetical protein